jgi:AcrR family transcriptional regulator
VTKAGQSARTRAALIASGWRLFGERGYAGVSAEEIARDAGVTTGALYHQFRNKRDLFAAVFEAVEQQLTLDLMAFVPASSDPLLRFAETGARFLEASRDPALRRIVIVDGRAVLGWDEWHATMLRYGLGITRSGLGALMATGVIRTLPLDAAAHVVLGALSEGAILVAESSDPDTAQAEVTAALLGLLEGLRS